MVVGKWVDGMPDDCGLNWFANSFGDLLDLIDTCNFLDNVALLDVNWGINNDWVVDAVFGYNFVAWSGVGLFVGGSNMICSSNWGNSWCNSNWRMMKKWCGKSKSIVWLSISITLAKVVSGNRGSNNSRSNWGSSAVLAGNLLAYLFILNMLSSDSLSFTNVSGCRGAYLCHEIFSFELAVRSKSNWCRLNNGGGGEPMVTKASSQKQLLSIAIFHRGFVSWRRQADGQEAREDDDLKQNSFNSLWIYLNLGVILLCTNFKH